MTEAIETTEFAGRFPLTDKAVAKDPSEFFATLRSKCPVARSEAFDGFWTVARYSDVSHAALTPETFSNTGGITIPRIPQPPVICIEQDDPEHRKYRKPLQGWFSVKRMQVIEDQVRRVVSGYIDAVIEDGRGDLATILATPVPPTAIALILGLPEKDWSWFRDQEIALLTHAQNGDVEAAGAVHLDVAGYLGNCLAERRRSPQGDMMSDIAALTVDGEPISDSDAVSLAILILGAGLETTVGGIGGMLYQVLKDPDLRDRLIADPSLIAQAVEEALRLETPLPGLARTVSEATTVEGVSMSEGDRVMLLWGSANRDPEVFDSPDEFRVDRPNVQKHLAFGAGVHRCVGAPLARLEMRVVLEEVLRRMPAARLTDPDAVEVTWTVGRDFRRLDAVW
ncbi:cytochrome P450 [Pseudonocardia nematodicida]|uniref:Cytochrome P450 n=1 Tax=Pseudonocardia nematodicida TaxID=1206997 RepID=A0ABV1K5N6_9PSEU